MSELNIKNAGIEQKVKETHFEYFLRVFRKILGNSPLHFVEKHIIEDNIKDFNPVDDSCYQAAALDIFNKILETKGFEKKFDMKMVYDSPPEFLGEYRSILNMLHHTHRFSKSKMVFRFEEALTAKILHTDISKVDSHFVTSPFSSVFIDIPYNQELYIPNPYTGLHKVKGIYISYTDNIDVRGVNLPSEKKLDEDGIHPDLKFNGKPATKLLRVLAVAEHNENSKDRMDDATFFMSFFLSPGDIFAQVERSMDIYTSENDKKNKVYMQKLFSFVLNALLYITNPSADLQVIQAKFYKPTRGKKANNKNTGLSKINVVSAGHTLKISHEFRKQYRSGNLRTVTINVPKWMVRGHWRNQAYGPSRSLRRLQWIEPHEKGKGIQEEAKGRDYVVG